MAKIIKKKTKFGDFWQILDKDKKVIAKAKVREGLETEREVKTKFHKDRTLLKGIKVIGKETVQGFFDVEKRKNVEEKFPDVSELKIPRRNFLSETGWQYYVKVKITWRKKIRIGQAYSTKRFVERTADNVEDARNDAIETALGTISKTFYSKDVPDDLEILDEKITFFGRRL